MKIKKPIVLAILGLMVSTLLLAWANVPAEPKEYITIYTNEYLKMLSVTKSDGSYKEEKLDNSRGPGDQGAILRLVGEYESQGYRLNEYTVGSSGGQGSKTVISALMAR